MPDQPIPPPGPEALAAQREALVERLAEGHWRLDWPNQSYPWPEENRPTADAHRRGARRCLDGIALAGLRLVPADTEPSDAEQAAAWMHEAWHQATERDRQYQRAEALAADAGRLRTELRDARNDLLDIRGILSPADRPDVRVVPMELELGPRVAPAVEWLVAELAALAPGWESPAALQAAYSDVLARWEAAEAERDQLAQSNAQLTADLAQARRDAASWEDWGRGWKTQAEANQAERDKAWAELDRLAHPGALGGEP